MWLKYYIYTSKSKQYNKKALHWGKKGGNTENYKNTDDCLYGKPIWNTGAARRSRPLRRDFPPETCAAKADAKLGSSTKNRLWGLAGGLEISNLRSNFTGPREIFLFRLLGEDRSLLGSGSQEQGK